MTESKHYSFFQNRQCEFFPCHKGIPEAEFNCLFCYCPLYALGKRCGGAYTCTDQGCKDCSACTFPHWRGHYADVSARYGEIMELIRLQDGK